jgi:hypothetical protein
MRSIRLINARGFSRLRCFKRYDEVRRVKLVRVRQAALAISVMMGFGTIVLTMHAQTRAYTPEKGSAERKAITDALRVPVQKKLKRQVIFKIDHLKVQNGWAFLLGAPRRPDGGELDYHGTPYAEAYNAGAFGDDIMALLHKVGGQWRVVQYVIGATDVAYLGWARKFQAPAEIFPY